MTDTIVYADGQKAALTSKQIRFCHEYVKDLNATQAFIRAGYSENGAQQNSHTLIARPHIKQLVAELEDDLMLRAKVEADQVIAQTARLAFSDIRRLFNEDGSIKRIENIDRDTAAALQSIKVTKRKSGERSPDGEPVYEEVIEFKLADKKGPLELLGKHHRLFTDRLEVSDDTELSKLMAEGRQRALEARKPADEAE